MKTRYIIGCFNRRSKRGRGLLSVMARSKKKAMQLGENLLRGTKDMPHDAEPFSTFFRRVKGMAVDDMVYRNWNPAMRP